MGSISSAFKKLTSELITKPLGSLTGANTAQRSQNALAAALEQQQAQQRAIQTNMAADLKMTDPATVIAGGSADATDALRKKKSTGIGASLGLSL